MAGDRMRGGGVTDFDMRRVEAMASHAGTHILANAGSPTEALAAAALVLSLICDQLNLTQNAAHAALDSWAAGNTEGMVMQ